MFLVCISLVLNGVQGIMLNQQGDKKKALECRLKLIRADYDACRLANDSIKKEIEKVKDFRNHVPEIQDSIIKEEKLKRLNHGQSKL
jgi:hypothetical protein